MPNATKQPRRAAGERRAASLRFVAACLLLGGSSALAEEPQADVVGGPDPSGQNFEWRVTNRASKPIIAVEFPHYGADLFYVPHGWQSDCTHLVGIGVTPRQGLCRAKAASVASQIAPGQSGVFRMRASARGAQTDRGRIVIELADGGTLRVDGVFLPVAEPWLDRYLPLVGLAVLVGIAAFYKAAVERKRRRPAAARASQETAPDG